VKTGQHFQKLVGGGGNRHMCVCTHTQTRVPVLLPVLSHQAS